MMEKLVIELGKDAYQKLSDDEKRFLKLFIWAGCGCHKDLNTARSGNRAMELWWDKNGIPGPILLANKDNKAVLNMEELDSDTLTPAQEQALEMSARGGVKATKLAGDIFNNKDDKMGYHNDFHWWWSVHVNQAFTFPDTSNNRFQSHCGAAAALLLYLSKFIEFLEYIRDKKKTGKFNNMKQNLWNVLHYPATKTELAVLALYGQAISHSYMKQI